MAKRRLSERQFETRLARWIERRIEGAGGRVCNYVDAGVLTYNRGLVVDLPNGQQFQITIVESTRR